MIAASSNLPCEPGHPFIDDLAYDFGVCADLVNNYKLGLIDTIPEAYKDYFVKVVIGVLQSQNIDRSAFLRAWDGIVEEVAP